MFGRIFGQDPKLEFRKPGGRGVSLLCGSPIAPDDSYWAQYWTLFNSASEVLTLLDLPTLESALHQSPRNIATLIKVLYEHLVHLLANVPPPGKEQKQQDWAKEALNCVRVLSRVVPVAFSNDRLEHDVFWSRANVAPSSLRHDATMASLPTEAEGGVQFVIDDEDDEDSEAMRTTESKTQATQERVETLPPLAFSLLHSLVDLCFVPGFTVAEECRTADGAVTYVIWEPGIASPAPVSAATPSTSPELLASRLEIVRLLTILLSLPSLHTYPGNYSTSSNPWREAFVSSHTLERKVVLCLLCSLLNTAFASPPSTSSPSSSFPFFSTPSSDRETERTLPTVSPSLGTVANQGFSFVQSALAEGVTTLRKTSMAVGVDVGGGEDVKGLLGVMCLQLLGCVLLDHGSTPSASASPPTQPHAPRPSPSSDNQFAFYLSKLHRPSDFAFLLSGLSRILSGPVPPSGSKGHQDSLVVFWRALELNPKKLVAFLSSEGKMAEVLVWLVVLCLDGRGEETQMGLTRLAAFLLQSLTSLPNLAAQINSPFVSDVLPKGVALARKYNIPAGSSIADFIIISLYTLIFSTRARLASLYPAFVLSITNISPHVRQMSSAASTRLCQLFLAFSAPGFLLMEEGNPRLVFYLLETFNNVIHHQFAKNPQLIYAIVRAHKRFECLSTFTLAAGVAEVRRLRQEKKASTAPPRSSIASDVSSNPMTEVPMKDMSVAHEGRKPGGEDKPEVQGEEQIVSEKAMGKRRERGVSIDSTALRGLEQLTLDGTHSALGDAGASEGEETLFVGKHGFVPTEGWVTSWRDGLPLDTIAILLAEVRPHLLDLSSSDSPTSDQDSIAYLRSVQLDTHLPPAPPVRPRPFVFTPQSEAWFASLLYGSVFLVSLDFLRNVPVQLFAVAQQQRKSSSATELVSGAASFVMNKIVPR